MERLQKRWFDTNAGVHNRLCHEAAADLRGAGTGRHGFAGRSVPAEAQKNSCRARVWRGGGDWIWNGARRKRSCRSIDVILFESKPWDRCLDEAITLFIGRIRRAALFLCIYGARRHNLWDGCQKISRIQSSTAKKPQKHGGRQGHCMYDECPFWSTASYHLFHVFCVSPPACNIIS